MKLTLLEQAKNIKRKRKLYKKFSDEELDVVCAYLKEEIDSRQAYFAFFPEDQDEGIPYYTRLYSLLHTAIKEAYKKGRIIIK